MRTLVTIDGVNCSQKDADIARATARRNQEAADALFNLAERIEDGLQTPEPLVAGDIVTSERYPEKGRMVVLQGGSLGAVLTAEWGRVDVRVTNGRDTYSGPAVKFTKVGSLREGVK